MLAGLVSRESVPEGLVFFRDGPRHLVVNPELGAWQVLDAGELETLRRLAAGEPPDGADPRAERVLAKLVMGWMIYLPGGRPAPRQPDAPRSNAVFAGDTMTDCRRCYIRGACAGGCRAHHVARTGDPRRNSRALCRMLRHQMITSMWIGAGSGRDTILDSEDEAMRPMLLSGEVHPVYEDWKAEAAALAAAPVSPAPAAPSRQLPLAVLAGQR